MNKEAAKLAFKLYDDKREQEKEQANLNATCFYQGCTEPPIGSHIISKKLLRRIAENGYVLTWPSSADISLLDIANGIDEGKSIKHLNMIPELVGIGDVHVTDPLFCHPHDEKIFKQIDMRELASRSEFIPKQVLLLAYRALCSLSFLLSSRQSSIDSILEFSKKVGYSHSLSEAENYAKVQRFMAKETMLAIYRRYEQIRKSGDYSQLGYALYEVNMTPCIATTYSLIPVVDDEAKAIVSGTLLLNPEDVVSFTFLPHKPLTNSICVISWLKGSERAHRFMALNRINRLSDKEQRDLFLHFALESPTVYMSPQWWNSLNGEKRVEYTLIHFNAGREHAELI